MTDLTPLVGILGGAGAVGIGTVAGAYAYRVTHRKPKSKAICSCGHGFGTHAVDGNCNGGEWQHPGYEYRFFVECRCLHYDGPPAWVQ